MDHTNQVPEITCKRGFHTKEEVKRNIGTSIGGDCNGCPNFNYSGGMGFCKYDITDMGGFGV